MVISILLWGAIRPPSAFTLIESRATVQHTLSRHRPRHPHRNDTLRQLGD